MLVILAPGPGVPQRATILIGAFVGLHLGMQVWRLQWKRLTQNAFFARLALMWLGSILGISILRISFGASLFSGSAMAGMAGGYMLAVLSSNATHD